MLKPIQQEISVVPIIEGLVFDVLGVKLGSCSCWAGASPGAHISTPCRRFFKDMEMVFRFPLLLFQKVCTHLHNWSFSFFFPLKLFGTQNVLFRSWFIRQRTEESGFRYVKSQGVFPYIATETFVAHSGLKGYYSKFIPEFFFYFQKRLQWAL